MFSDVATATDAHKPPYMPWKTFEGFVGRLQADSVPDRVDKSTMRTYSGATQSQLSVGMKFLGLINGEDRPQPALVRLVEAHGTDDWPEKVGALIRHAYASIMAGVNLGNATQQMLKEAFRDRGQTEGSVTDKSIRFYLKAAEVAGLKISPHAEARRGRPSGSAARTNKKKPAAKRKASGNGGGDAGSEVITVPVHFRNKSEGSITVPRNLTTHDLKMLRAALDLISLQVIED